jgi:glycosidase
MQPWPMFPTIYEINTWAWLTDLSQQASKRLTLSEVPQAELERIAAYGFDGVWLMGVWQRSPGARQIALTYPGWQSDFQQALPGYTSEDIVGSPYAILDYRVDSTLGGDDGLAVLRSRLQDLGLRLILDFVPNHMALDHPWLETHPERFVQGDSNKLANEPANYFSVDVEGSQRIFAHGRDPYFEGWPDTIQLDYRAAATRRAMADELLSIAARCDGVRCDMSMLLVHDVFLHTWSGQFDPPAAEFWPAAMTDIKAKYPDFLTMAEVYWDMEWQMQQQGFGYTYDKHFYDRLLHENGDSVRQHLRAGLDYQQHLARFIENHDEPRAAKEFGIERSKVAAVLSLTLPGLRLVHEGQIEGKRVKFPVHLGRRPFEEPEGGLDDFYRRLLKSLRHPIFHNGEWQLMEIKPAWDNNFSFQNIVAHRWKLGEQVRIIITNLSDEPAQSQIMIAMPGLAGREWLLCDLLNETQYQRSGDEILNKGLYVELQGYGYHLFEVLSL